MVVSETTYRLFRVRAPSSRARRGKSSLEADRLFYELDNLLRWFNRITRPGDCHVLGHHSLRDMRLVPYGSLETHYHRSRRRSALVCGSHPGEQFAGAELGVLS